MNKLLKLAEAMGLPLMRDVYQAGDNIWLEGAVHKSSCKFNPLNNAEQCLEIMEHFKIGNEWHEDFNKWHASGWIESRGMTIVGRGKTIQEAVLNCALEIVN